jgi:predicted nucleic acid-binding protein
VGTVVLDSDVVIGLLDPSDAHHSAASAALDNHVDDEVYLPASCYSEVLVAPMRDGRASVVHDFVTAADIHIVPLDRTIAELAAGLRARHRSLRLPGALALATAQSLGVTLLTFDKRLAVFQ